MKFTVTKNGEPLDPSLYTWDETNKTFTSYILHLILDFSGINNVTFDISNNCIIRTGDNCTFKTGGYCIFKTGNNCVFNVLTDCVFDVGDNCRATYLKKKYQLKSNKPVLLLCDANLRNLFGYIISQNSHYPILWWKNVDGRIFIKVGCQEHSLDFWKVHYNHIAKKNDFPEKLIPEFLQHLKTIEESLI